MAITNTLNIQIESKNNYFLIDGNKIKISKKLEKKLGNKEILKKDILKIAQLIRDKISSNIARAISFDGRNLPNLATSTIKKKGFSRILYDTGKMLLGVIVSNEGGIIIIRMKNLSYPKKKGGANLQDVAAWTQAGSAHRPARRFFGITQKDARKFIEIVINDRIKKI